MQATSVIKGKHVGLLKSSGRQMNVAYYFRFLLILFLEICEQHYKINFTHDFLSFRSFVIRGCSCIAFWDGRQPVPILTTLWSWGRVVRNIFKDTMDSLTHSFVIPVATVDLPLSMPCSSEESEMMMNKTYLIWHSEYPNSHLLNRWVCSSWILDILKNLDKKCPFSPLLVDRNNEVCDT